MKKVSVHYLDLIKYFDATENTEIKQEIYLKISRILSRLRNQFREFSCFDRESKEIDNKDAANQYSFLMENLGVNMQVVERFLHNNQKYAPPEQPYCYTPSDLKRIFLQHRREKKDSKS
jgi:hypothetical protein